MSKRMLDILLCKEMIIFLKKNLEFGADQVSIQRSHVQPVLID
jgi:hypothetical protein